MAVFSDALPERNGAGAYYRDLAEQLEPRLERIEIFQPSQKIRLLQMAIPLPGDPTQKLITPNIPRLWKQFVRLQPDVVVAVTPGPFGLLGLFLAQRFGRGFLTGFHTHFEELVRLYTPMTYHISRFYLESTNRILCKRSASVLVNNPGLAEIVQKLGAREVDVIGTPFPLNFLAEPLIPPRGKLQTVLFAGRLAHEKNLPVVIEAARKLPDVRFVLAGDGPLRKTLEDQCRDLPNVRFTGWLKRADLRREMDDASLLILPSHNETFGTVALESMARGRPALVAQNAGIHQWDALADGLIMLRDGECVAGVLRRLQEQPAQFWIEKAGAARKAAEALNSATLDHWIEVLTRHSRNPQRPVVSPDAL